MHKADNGSTKKVLIIANEWSRDGGLEIVTQDIALAFATLGWQVTVVPASGEGRTVTLASGIRVKWLPPRGRFFQSLWHRYLKWPILSCYIKRHLKGGGLLIFGHAHLLPLLDRLPAKGDVSYWGWVHGIEVWGHAAKKWLPYLNKLDNLVAVSKYTAEHVKKVGVMARLSVVFNSVDANRFKPTMTPDRIRRDEILICGRLSASERYKGHDILFEALPIAETTLGRELKIRVVGTGNDLVRLKEKARSMGLEKKVVFSGRVTDDELLEAFQHCGLFAMPSRAEYRIETKDWAGEGFGLVYAEAEACGRPVVCSIDGGAPETIIHEVTGLLADPRSPQANAEAIVRILKNQEWADKLGKAGRDHVVKMFSFEKFKQNIDELVASDIKLKKLSNG